MAIGRSKTAVGIVKYGEVVRNAIGIDVAHIVGLFIFLREDGLCVSLRIALLVFGLVLRQVYRTARRSRLFLAVLHAADFRGRRQLIILAARFLGLQPSVEVAAALVGRVVCVVGVAGIMSIAILVERYVEIANKGAVVRIVRLIAVAIRIDSRLRAAVPEEVEVFGACERGVALADEDAACTQTLRAGIAAGERDRRVAA